MSMITASIWVPRGSAAAFPVKYDIDEIELARISTLAKLQLEDAQAEFENAKYRENDAASAENSSDEDEVKIQRPRSQEYVFHP